MVFKSMCLAAIIGFVLNVSSTSAKVYSNCEFARTMLEKGVPRDQLATWTCIAYHESRFNTKAINGNTGDYGILQISHLYWCSDSDTPGKGCGITCKSLLDDDISNDIACARQVFDETQRFKKTGFEAWTVYSANCQGDQNKWLDGCGVNDRYERHVAQTRSLAGSNVNNSSQLGGEDEGFAGFSRTMFRSSIYLLAIVYLLHVGTTSAKTYTNCEFAKTMLNNGIPKDQLGTWTCIASHESNFNTDSINHDTGDYGILQISHLYWCSDTDTPGKGCGITCKSLLSDDITEDITCAKKVFEETVRLKKNGFLAWTTYEKYCTGDQSKAIDGCGL
ncbi:uncharacterized protein LOC132703201 [Cylas formicarius]|uniref:uncharacterized protein LOC132703201 n=1 Tax=Cylas formicarius TaxID=197179 RepID=UPI0029588347|nr:uncharacterized protein LOC132703201 [Cylas formicarius]